MSDLNQFANKRVKATVINGYCVEDLDLLKTRLEEKYSEVAIDQGSYFLIAGQKITKPWLQRERIGIFRLQGQTYCIENLQGSVEGVSLPKRSFYPITNLQVIDDKTLLLTLDKEKDYKIEYRVSE